MPHHGDKRRRIATSSDVHGDPEFWSQKRLLSAVGRLQQQVIEDHKMMRDVEKYMTNIFKATSVNGWTPKLVRDAKFKSEPKDKYVSQGTDPHPEMGRLTKLKKMKQTAEDNGGSPRKIMKKTVDVGN